MTVTTVELAHRVIETMGERNLALLKGHGVNYDISLEDVRRESESLRRSSNS